ncbi:MAG TPA: PRC-barrel domain-containing protein [Solirubrobacterales bacterium]
MDDLGEPTSYLTLADGLPVYSSDGEKVGVIEHVLAEPEEDIFDGIVLDTSVLPGGHRFVDAPEVDRIHERGVVLKVDAAAAESLPEPSENPGVLEAGGDDAPPSPFQQKLGRAWDRISGNY